jgi:hypothetical protein
VKSRVGMAGLEGVMMRGRVCEGGGGGRAGTGLFELGTVFHFFEVLHEEGEGNPGAVGSAEEALVGC